MGIGRKKIKSWFSSVFWHSSSGFSCGLGRAWVNHWKRPTLKLPVFMCKLSVMMVKPLGSGTKRCEGDKKCKSIWCLRKCDHIFNAFEYHPLLRFSFSFVGHTLQYYSPWAHCSYSMKETPSWTSLAVIVQRTWGCPSVFIPPIPTAVQGVPWGIFQSIKWDFDDGLNTSSK